MVKNKDSFKTTATIKELTIGVHSDKITFIGLNLNNAQNDLMSEMVKTESGVRLTLGLQTPDAEFPDIVVEGTLKSHKISKTVDAPNIKGISFTSHQVDRIANYIRSEEELSVTFTKIQNELPLVDGDGDKKTE